MTQKLLTPFKKLPQQIQNLQIFQKLQDLTTRRQAETLACHCASVYGIMEHPVALAHDQDLCLLAVAYKHGHINVYGAPGLCFLVDCVVEGIKFVEFLQNEGRLLLATQSSLTVLELNAISCCWQKKISVNLPFAPDECITAIAIGKGVVYVGSSTGTLRQVAIENGNLTVGDDDLTSLPYLLILNGLPEEKREALKLNTPIVSIELNPNGEELLLGYAGGIAVVVQPQPIPDAQSASVENPPTETDEKLKENESEKKRTETSNEATDPVGEPAEQAAGDTAPEQTTPKKSKTGERHTTANLQAIRAQATKKFRTLSKTIKSKVEYSTVEKADLLPVPPSPHVICLLPYGRVLCYATWRITSAVLASESKASHEVVIAYDDGAYLIWNMPKSESGTDEPVIVTNQEVASIPYGPLPCSAIQRIISRPSVSGGAITAFVGGLPRAQHAEKHTISVLGGVDEHVCFQFGSAVRDIVILPSQPQQAECRSEQNEEASKTKDKVESESEHHPTQPSNATDAGYLLVLTDHELMAIDLTQPSWPVIASPYIKHLDCTDITAIAHASIPKNLMIRLKEAATVRSFDDWPVIGGRRNRSCEAIVQHAEFYDLIAIAHANADVSLWHVARGGCFEGLGRICSLAMMLEAEELGCRVEKKNEEEAWPPFRKVGDCFCQASGDRGTDSRCAVRSLSLQLVDEEVSVVVGGSAGNCSIWSSDMHDPFEPDVSTICVDLLNDSDRTFIWEGHEPFKPLEGTFKPNPVFTSMFGLCELIQFNPPSAITAAVFEPRWKAVAIGSAHGFALIDLKTRSVVYKRLTCDLQVVTEPASSSAAREVTTKIAAGGRQLKKTLRDSFRKIGKVRSQPTISAVGDEKPTATDTTEAAAEAAKDEKVKATASEVVEETLVAAAEMSDTTSLEAVANDTPLKPTVTIEPKATEAAMPHQLKPTDKTSGVSALALADTYVISDIAAAPKEHRPAFPSPRTAALIVGTQDGVLITHTLAWPVKDAPIEVKPVKEVVFQHGAPVLKICALDAKAHYSPVAIEKSHSVPEVIPEPPESGKQKSESSKPPQGEEIETKAIPTAASAETEGADEAQAQAPAEVQAEAEASKAVLMASHELLVCTEGQVRLLALPSLKTKHKYHFWEKTTTGVYGNIKPPAFIRRGKSEHSTNTTNISAEDTASPSTQVNTDGVEAEATATPQLDNNKEKREQEEKSEEPTVTVTSSPATPCNLLHRVAAFGLQQFPLSSGSTTQEWYAVVALRNGRLHVLSIPGLRRILKASCLDCCSKKSMSVLGLAAACVSTSANLAFWSLNGCVLVADEISHVLPCRLASPIIANGLKTTGEMAYCVCLPEWARPKPLPVPVTDIAASSTTEDAHAVDAMEGTQGEHGKDEEAEQIGMDEMKDIIADPVESACTAKEVDDFTKDMTKGIVTDDGGVVTVKTTESSLEKHTVIEKGNVLTTVHEIERVDGEIVKNDIVHVKSDADDNAAVEASTDVTA